MATLTPLCDSGVRPPLLGGVVAGLVPDQARKSDQ